MSRQIFLNIPVTDLPKSKAFYEALGFSVTGGDATQNWLVLRNNGIVVGLFQGMFEKNMLCFNPGWDNNGRNVDPFTDVRELQRQLKARGITPVTEGDETTTGPGHFIVVDPDGNPVLVDQHR